MVSKVEETLTQHQHYKQECNVENRTIFCHDNLQVLQGINNECIDLIYLDPPFNKKKVFVAPINTSAEGASFRDIFTQEDVKDDWLKTIEEDHYSVHELLNAVKRIAGRTSYNFCYLAYMAIRLIEMHRVLKDTGSVYLHCDHTMSHYLKLLLDCIFGEQQFRNEIIWCYHGPGSPHMKQFNRKSDSILYYSKGSRWTFNKDDIRIPFKDPNQSLRRAMSTDNTFTQAEVEEYRKRGKIPENWWEMRIAARSKKENVHYPTQKPLALLERIIKASSNKGDVVLDPFCGCATTCVAAEKLERHWIGVDISVKAYELVKKRLKKEVANPDNLFDYDKAISFFSSPPKRTDSGAHAVDAKYIYVISHPLYPKEYKVGIASDPKSRLTPYQTGDPNRSYKIEYQVRVAKYRELERYIHKIFPNKHEWVHGDLQEIIKEIEQNANKVEEEVFNET